jgi:ketosteroid isomerase-like protein
MPSRERVQEFVDAVTSGRFLESIDEFYWEDATAQENLQPPRRGRLALIANEEKALRGVRRMFAHPQPTLLVDGDHVVIHWRFDMTGHDGVTRRLDELSLQRWRGDRIASERFFYDPGSIAALPDPTNDGE